MAYLVQEQRWFAQVRWPMTCLGRAGQLSTQVHRLVQLDLETLAGVVRMVQLFATSVGSWCLSELCIWFGLLRSLARGISTCWLSVWSSCRCIGLLLQNRGKA